MKRAAWILSLFSLLGIFPGFSFLSESKMQLLARDERMLADLYSQGPEGPSEGLSDDELRDIFKKPGKKEVFFHLVRQFREDLEKNPLQDAKRPCPPGLSGLHLELALYSIDAYNLSQGSDEFRKTARQAAENAVRCDAYNSRARRLLRDLR